LTEFLSVSVAGQCGEWAKGADQSKLEQAMSAESGTSRAGAAEGARESYFEEMPILVAILDPHLRIVDSNGRFRERFGDGMGQPCWEACRGQGEKCPGCVAEQTLVSGEEKSGIETFYDKTGREIPVIVCTTPVWDSAGRITRIIQASVGISEYAQVRDQSNSLGMLINSISHGIKGVLATLDGGIYIVNSGFERDDQSRLKEGWDIVQRNIDQMRNLVLHILYYATERGLEFWSIDAARFAEEVLTKMEYRADALGVDLERDFDPSVGEFEADENALRVALVNILENALDACQADDVKGTHRVSFGLSRDGEEVIFTVLDNGIGMDRETRERLFRPLFCSVGRERIGLGLSVCNKIVRQHGGSLGVSSTLGVGSSFTLRIPRNQKESGSVLAPPRSGSWAGD
jgi:signal transduction histidine kinase